MEGSTYSSVLSNMVAQDFDRRAEAMVGAQSELATLRAGQHEIRLHTQLTRERLLKVQCQLQPTANTTSQPVGVPARSTSSLEATFASSTAHLADGGDIFDGGLSTPTSLSSSKGGGFVPGSTPRVGSKAAVTSAPTMTVKDPFPLLSNPRPISELVEVVMPHYIFKLANMKRGMVSMQTTLAEARKEANEIYTSSGLPPRVE